MRLKLEMNASPSPDLSLVNSARLPNPTKRDPFHPPPYNTIKPVALQQPQLLTQKFQLHTQFYIYTMAEAYPHQTPSSPVTRGAFIVIEGLDRAGKTTQVKRLCDTLHAEGHNVEMLRFPGMSILTSINIISD